MSLEQFLIFLTWFTPLWCECVRSIVVLDDIFCIFVGTLANIAELRHHYGLPRQATEAVIVVEAYKALRDRAPYPPDQVVKDLDGKFAFTVFDARTNTLFVARVSYEEKWHGILFGFNSKPAVSVCFIVVLLNILTWPWRLCCSYTADVRKSLRYCNIE